MWGTQIATPAALGLATDVTEILLGEALACAKIVPGSLKTVPFCRRVQDLAYVELKCTYQY